jgi:hypothetical protein
LAEGKALIVWSIPALERVGAVNGQSSPLKTHCGHTTSIRIAPHSHCMVVSTFMKRL